ncbi:hypothetical protein B0919_19255 [Hymenobacter sp. CRA2]|nr:hypothetical protein B0919_19255 [Hymenobacter sp. CRA2]
MITYTDLTSPADAKNDEVIFFGDGTNATVFRQGGRGTNIGNNINRNVYYFEHTYNAPGRYTVAFIGENRATGIRNVPSSDQRNFYIYTLITIDPTLGVNRSPVLNAPAVDRAARAQVFLHNPAASDADGDSLAYKLRICQYDPRGVQGTINPGGNRPQPTNLPGYLFPDDPSFQGTQVAYPGPPVGQPGNNAVLDLSVVTGQMVWNSPGLLGDYNVAFVVEEWRRDANGGRRKIGEVLRDMQVTVFATANQRPLVIVPRDTCVVAGTTITRTIRATDPDNNAIRLTAYGGIFPPATFRQTVNQAGRAEGVFTWSTSCSDVATDPTQVVFKAEDQPTSGPVLIDERPWRITVVGPPPTNLRAAAQGSTVQLTWDRYVCQNASRLLIYRKENPSTWNPSGACDVGIPASAGYVQVGTVAANLQTFLDDNAGRGLDRGKTYCYRIYAEFPRPAGGASLASREACVTLQGRAALFTNVTVDRTDATTGQITVKWTKPFSTSGFTPPVGYRLFRGETQNPATNGYTLVRTFSNLNDTVYVDGNLDTENKAYTYRLEFFSNVSSQPNSAVLTETAGPASSVRLAGVANALGNSIKLTWTYNVPWDNSRQRTRIFRRDPGSTTFVLIGDTVATRNGGTFTDRGTAAVPLRKNQTYCYYVETNGTYGAANLPTNLINLSQVRCVALASIPCPPILTLRPINCDSVATSLPRGRQALYDNRLTWVLGNTPADCGRNIAFYRVLYSPTQDGQFTEIGRTPVRSFVHRNLTSAAGCYAVVAVDSTGQSSVQSNIECQDNCEVFVLPNIFTPNGDGSNDTFRPIFATPITRAKVQIFNRWGVKVYEGNAAADLTLWDGGGVRSGEGRDGGAKASAGTYYYLIEVEFNNLKRTVRSYKGWLEVMR